MPLLLTILGARPQFIKAAALTRAIAKKVDLGWSQSIIHTGQHYDAKLSDIFFVFPFVLLELVSTNSIFKKLFNPLSKHSFEPF